MNVRLNFRRVEPEAYVAMAAMDKYIDSLPIEQTQKEIIKIKASQINGCAYCTNKHSKEARKIGMSEQRVIMISAWKEAGEVFSEDERLILKMTEEVTLIHQNGLTADTYQKAITAFGEQKTAQIIMAIIAINAWNRIGVAGEMKPPVDK